MAPPHKIDTHLQKYSVKKFKNKVEIPSFLERKKIEEKLSASLAEKEFLVKEIHHRVKNNLQIITSLLNLQSAGIKSKKVKDKYTESIGRIKSMAIIHELLYRSKNLSSIKIKDYLEELVLYISSTYNLGKKIQVDLGVDVVHKFIDLDKAIPCGIIINELLSNAFKYAFTHRKQDGVITIYFSENKGRYTLTVSDNGIGLPKSMNVKTSSTLGLQLINSLVEQLSGELSMRSNKGTSFTISFA